MTTIFRLNSKIISVDGIKCKLCPYDGRYYPIREDLENVTIFTTVIDSFLIMEEKISEAEFEDELEEMLFESGINFPDL